MIQNATECCPECGSDIRGASMTGRGIRLARRVIGAHQGRRSISQAELGEAVGGYTARTVRNWETGATKVPPLVGREVRRLLDNAIDGITHGRKARPLPREGVREG